MPLLKQLEKLIAYPLFPENDYIFSKYTYDAIYKIAARFQKNIFPADTEESICLCINDRGIMAGALIAALTRPVSLILPNAYSASVLERMHQAIAFSRAIVQEPIALPRDVTPVFFDRDNLGNDTLDRSFVRHPDSVLVKLFTGGSTKTPRIWSKTVRNLFSEAIHHAENLDVSSHDRIVATVPPNHIYGLLFSVLTPFVASASVVDEELTYPHEIQNAVKENQGSILISTPLHYKMLAGIPFKAESLRLAISSAARLDAADSRFFHQKTGLGITEIFGSTETGGIASRLCNDKQPDFELFECVDWKIVKDLLAIRSDFISPELPVDPEGFFTTNDQVNIKGPDRFELKGRADRIVKVGGKRVDLDEIKSAITGMPKVKDAAVICIPNDSARENKICALVAADASSSEIRQYLKHRIQSYAVPRLIRIVEKIPVSSTGKYENAEIKRLLESISRY